MHDLILAFRNAARNRRRSLVTVLALALCCAGLILFAGYVTATFAADESRTVTTVGHVQIFRHDFPERGIGSPGTFRIENHEELRRQLIEDPVLGPMIHLATPQLTFTGLASHYGNGTSTGFVGNGVLADDYFERTEWNPHRLSRPFDLPINTLLYQTGPHVSGDHPEGGSIGTGLAEILGIAVDDALLTSGGDEGTASPTPAAEAPEPAPPSEANDVPEVPDLDLDLPDFAALEAAAPQPEIVSDSAVIELLCAAQSGAAPNVLSLDVRTVRPFGTVQLDDRYVLMNLEHASRLLFPGEPVQATSILIMLHDSDDTDRAVARVREILAAGRPELECRTWIELAPFYKQITAYLKVIFVFMFGIIGSIVVFTIYNTLAAAIVERTAEIGTLRAMGVSQGRIAALFVYESVFMGIAGGILSIVLALAIGALINQSDIVFNAPTTSFYMKVEVMLLRHPVVLVYGFATAIVTAIISAILPASHASRMAIVDALRH